MGSKSDYLEDKLLNHTLRNVAFTAPATVYAALFTVTPSDTGGGTEVTGGSYARTAITFGAPSPSGTMSNSADVTFPTATADWGTVVAFGIFDASSAGNLLYWGAVTPNRVVSNGVTAKFSAAALVVTED